jgi:hypothetical protein
VGTFEEQPLLRVDDESLARWVTEEVGVELVGTV